MSRICCHVPIQLRVTGELGDAEFEQLERVLPRVLEERLELARRAVTGHANPSATACIHPPTFAFPEGFPPEQQYRIRSLLLASLRRAVQRTGFPGAAAFAFLGPVPPTPPPRPTFTLAQYRAPPTRPVTLALAPASRRPRFRLERPLRFRIRVRNYLDLLENVISQRSARARPSVAELRALLIDILDTVRPATLLRIVAREQVLVGDLLPILEVKISETVPPDQDFSYLWTIEERTLHRLRVIEEGNRLARVPGLALNRAGYTNNGQAFLLRNGILLVISLAIPRIRLEESVTLHLEIQATVQLRDLQFLVDPDLFERVTGAPWITFVQEFGRDPVILRLLPFHPAGRIHYETLNVLFRRRVTGQFAPEEIGFWRLRMLNQTALDWLPAAVRAAAESITDPQTRTLPSERESGYWEPRTSGAFVYAFLRPTETQINIALYRPEAREFVDRLAPFLSRNPTDFPWAYEVESLLTRQYRDPRPNRREPRGLAFEFVLAELEARSLFDRLFDAIEQANHWDLHHFVIRLCLAGSYAAHPRVLRTIDLINRRRRSHQQHTYRVAEKQILLKKDPDLLVGVHGTVNVWPLYIAKRTDKTIREPRLRELQEAVRDIADERIRQMACADPASPIPEATNEEFWKSVLAAAAERIKLSEDDLVELEIRRTARLLNLSAVTEEGIERYQITYDFIESVNDGSWQPVPESRRTQIDSDFEWLLWGWEYQHTAAVVQAFAIGVTVVAVIAIAWEVGLIALLIEAGGGAASVLISIGINELIYLLRVIFGDARLTPEGLLMTALEGYLMAVAFHGAGLLARGLARAIGTQTLRRVVGGWVAERLTVGVVGGAGSALLITFSEDLIRIASGGGGWTRPGDYVRKMALGAALGILFEFGTAPLQPLLRAAGRTGIETIENVIRNIREARLSGVRFTTMVSEALNNLHTKLSTVVGEAVYGDLVAAFRERVSQIVDRLPAELSAFRSRAILQRVLELSPEAFTRGSVEGLERLLAMRTAQLTDEAALGLFNRLSGTQLRSFLETLASDPVFADLVSTAGTLPLNQFGQRFGILADVASRLPPVPSAPMRGNLFAEGGTSRVYEVVGEPGLLLKQGGGRLPVEARGLIELESMGIDTVYAGTRRVEGQTNILLRRVEGVSSKDIIGRIRQPLRPPQNIDIVTQRTIDDLEKIYATLERNHANVGDFQFIVRSSDGAVFVNDPVAVNFGRGPSGNIENIIDRFRSILRQRQRPTGE